MSPAHSALLTRHDALASASRCRVAIAARLDLTGSRCARNLLVALLRATGRKTASRAGPRPGQRCDRAAGAAGAPPAKKPWLACAKRAVGPGIMVGLERSAAI